MPVDLTQLSEEELIALNRRIVERLQFLRSARALTQLARFTTGMAVEFTAPDGGCVRGIIARLNRQTATIVAGSARWRVSPSLLRPVDAPGQASALPGRVLPMPTRG